MLPRPVAPPAVQVRIAHLLSGVARKDMGALQRDLEAARSEVMGPFAGAALLRALAALQLPSGRARSFPPVELICAHPARLPSLPAQRRRWSRTAGRTRTW